MGVVTFSWEKDDASKKVKQFQKTNQISWYVLEVTNNCNFGCKWCYASSDKIKKVQHMEKAKLELLLEKLSDEKVKQVTFSGGEPLLYPHIKEGIKMAKDQGLVVHMNTNGYFLNKSLAQELKELGLSQVQINIDSIYKDKHDKIRGKTGSYKRALNALQNAVEAGMTAVSQTVLTKENEDEIIDIFKLARSFNIQRCRVWDITPCGTAIDKEDLRPTNYLKTLGELEKYASDTGAQKIEIDEPLLSSNFETNLKVDEVYCCASLGLFSTVELTGDAIFCAVYREKMYNIFDVIESGLSISEVHQEKNKEIFDSLKLPDKCNVCDYLSNCKGGCPARNLDGNGDYWCIK